MVRGVLYGSAYTAPKKPEFPSFFELEDAVRQQVDVYKKPPAAEGGVTGAGGLLLGLAGFSYPAGHEAQAAFRYRGLLRFRCE